MSEKLNHTKGPWEAESVMSDAALDICLVHPVVPVEETGWPVLLASVYHGQGVSEAEAVANARLIAAAPDLLAACEAVVDLCDKNGWIECRGNSDQIRIMFAAIEKAKGTNS